MKTYLPILLVILSGISACKKSNAPVTTMTVQANSDSAWTADIVNESRTGDITEIVGYKHGSFDYVALDIRTFQEGNLTYAIQNTGNWVNTTKSSAYAVYNGNYVLASTGSIMVTGHTSNTISGSFDFTTSYAHIRGTFIAPHP